MALKQNDFRDSLGCFRFFGATVTNNTYPPATLASNHRTGAMRNVFASDAGVSAKSSYPSGARHPQAWQMPQKAGGLASHNNTRIDVSQTGFAVRGLPGSGSSTITFTVDGTGGLIVSGSGSATITFQADGTILSVASGSGSATITFSPTALIGALAGLQAQANVTLSPTAVIRAVGYLSGISTNETEFSPDALARAVWDAVAADFNLAGTMGEALNNAGAGGNPWDALLVDNNDPGTFGERVQKLLTVAKFLGLK